MSTAKLTQRQQEVYDFIREKIRSRGYGPTVRDIGKHFDIKSPNGVMCHLVALVKKGLIVREKNLSRAISLTDEPTEQRPGLPYLGAIAAGTPIEAYEQAERLEIGSEFDGDRHYVLEVRGESMIEAHIQPGDMVIVRKQETANNGDIVVALVDDSETTLKRFYLDKGVVRLEPANSRLRPIYPEQVAILGVVVGLYRKY